jgi:cytochrome c553
MRKPVLVWVCALGLILAGGGAHAVAQHPSWAYGFVEMPPPGSVPAAYVPPPAPAAPAAGAAPAAAPDPTPLSIPGATRTFTRAQANDPYGPADWFPGDHPSEVPDIVAHGRRDAAINACGLCHYIGGHGRQENASLAGLPYDYFVQTMMDFKNDRRHSADPRKLNTNRMVAFAKAMTDEEIKAAARYFAAIPWTRYIRVVETRTVPKTRMQNGMFIRLEGNETEPLGMRIIESPENFERTELRDPNSGFVAYVPVGSVRKGEALVKSGGNGRTTQCALCHGANLEGLGPVPGIAGRSPSYIVRQLYDMQVGTRKGVWSPLMTPVVANLTGEDLVAIAAYTSSLVPQASPRRTAAR